eukprot:COSAG01_NODE_33273_length_567_cov_0.726496_1_plen_29_part_10
MLLRWICQQVVQREWLGRVAVVVAELPIP